MIPKIIHYCWFGGNPLPESAKKCIASWRKFQPDYEIKVWNEDNYDVTKCQYMADAYKEKKWAFVSDYCRIDVVYQYGGIYLDTDVEVLRPFDDLLKERMFCGFESRDPMMKKSGKPIEESVNLGLGYGAEKHHPALKDMLDLYATLSFYNNDGSLNLVACPRYQTQILKLHGLIDNGKTQRFDSGIAYGYEYFCPQSNITSKMLFLTKNTYSIHHFTCSWSDEKGKNDISRFLQRFLPYKIASFIARCIYFPFKVLKK